MEYKCKWNNKSMWNNIKKPVILPFIQMNLSTRVDTAELDQIPQDILTDLHNIHSRNRFESCANVYKIWCRWVSATLFWVPIQSMGT